MPTTQVTPTEDVLLQGIADALLKARKVVVITGAGISTNSGIPDFRSENGLYSLIQAQFDAASRDEAPRSTCPSSADTTADGREPPTKRRRISFEDSGICLPSEDSQLSNNEDRSSPDEEGVSSEPEAPGPARTNAPMTRAMSRKSSPVHESHPKPTPSATALVDGCREPPTRPERILRRSRRAQSLPPEESPQKEARGQQRRAGTAVLRDNGSLSSGMLNTRGRSASPDPRRRTNAYQTRSAELRKRSLLTSSKQALRHDEGTSFASSPLKPCQTWPDEAVSLAESTSKPTTKPVSHTTPKNTRFLFTSSSPLSSPPSVLPQTPTSWREPDCLAQSNLSRPPLNFSSSPLSSPPPVLFDPFESPSSSASRQTSSAASSASSETDELPPSSNPNRSALPNIKGRDLFDSSIWADPLRTSVFYTFATTLRQKVKHVQPTESHHFIGHLRNRGKLVRCYTQNIDQIEEKVGLSTSLQEGPGHRGRFSRKSIGSALAPSSIPPAKAEILAGSGEVGGEDGEVVKPEEAGTAAERCDAVNAPVESQAHRTERRPNGVECVFLHGSLESLRCFLCGKICPWDEPRSHQTLSGRQPECPYCAGATAARQERGKRALGVGKLRPDIVLYGEEHPNAHLISPIVTHDLTLSPDLLLILGTSLKVHGLKVLVREFAKSIHSRGGKVVFVNFTKPPESSWGDIIDYWVQWDCDAWVSNLKDRIPLMWLPPGTKLPKKKKEGGDKTKKRQNNTDVKPKPEPAKEEVPETITTSTITAKPEPEPKEPGSRGSRPVKETPPTPQRPMAVRDDKSNAAWAVDKIRNELRRITGGQALAPRSLAPPRVTKPSQKRSRRSAPAALSRPAQHDLNSTFNPRDLEWKPPRQPAHLTFETPEKQEVLVETSVVETSVVETARPEEPAAKSFVAGDFTMSETTESSILLAVKHNPRRRKPKTIFGEDGSQKTPVAKTLPRPTPQKRRTPQTMDRPLVASPPTLSAIQDVSMAQMDNVTLPPIQPTRPPDATPSKPPPLEPHHYPTGPLTDMSPNSQMVRGKIYSSAFYYFDALALQLKTAPGWTPPTGRGIIGAEPPAAVKGRGKH